MVAEKRAAEERAFDLIQRAEDPSPGLVREFFDYLRYHKRWWLAPIIVAVLLVGVFLLLSSSALAPFIYPLF